MAKPKSRVSRFSRLTSGKGPLVVIFVIVAFYWLNTYRQNDPLPVSAVGPDMTLYTSDNQSFQLHDIHMPTILIFYSERKLFANNIYASIYEKEMPHMKLFQDDGMAQVVIVVKDVDTAEKLTEFLNKKDFTLLKNIAFALEDQSVAQNYGVRSWPHTYILDRNHRVRYRSKVLSGDSIRKALGEII